MFPSYGISYIVPQSFKKVFGKFSPLASGWTPNIVETVMSHHILGDSNSVIKIYDSVP